MFLREVQFLWNRLEEEDQGRWPYRLAAYQGMRSVKLERPVTFFVGENGTGKSTLLEGIAGLCGFPTSGGEQGSRDEHSALQAVPMEKLLRLSWMPRMKKGFFLRSETYYNFASLLDQRQEDRDFQDDPYRRYGGRPLHEQSHGESFLAMFQSRFREQGIYLLDEPEAALSPVRLLGFMRLMKQLTDQGRAQFVICTHSPILLGYPGADIWTFDQSPMRQIAYEETEHYAVTKAFLSRREQMLEELFAELE